MDLRFILGSAAHIDRFWSISKHILSDNRNSTSPQMLDGKIFLPEHTPLLGRTAGFKIDSYGKVRNKGQKKSSNTLSLEKMMMNFHQIRRKRRNKTIMI